MKEKEIEIDTLHMAVFADLLGISALYEEESEAALEKIHSATKVMRDYFKVEANARTDDNFSRLVPRAHFFSDSLYLSIPSEGVAIMHGSPYDYYGEYLTSVAFMQADMIIRHGIFMRGGIAMGKNIFTSELSVSKAFYKAYREEQNAIFPIIAFMPRLGEVIPSLKGVEAYGYTPPSETLVFKASTGGKDIYFLNYLEHYIEDCESFVRPPTQENIDKYVREVLEIHKKAIIKEYNETYVNEPLSRQKILYKYSWLAHTYHNIIAKKLCPENIDLLISEDEIILPNRIEDQIRNLEIEKLEKQLEKLKR